jgi:hypothetical protein
MFTRIRPAHARWAALTALAALALAGCGGSSSGEPHPDEFPDSSPIEGTEHLPPLDLAVLGSTAKVRPHETAEGPTNAVLFAARNEFESFQVAVNASAGSLRNLTVSLRGPLSGPRGAAIPAANVLVYRVGYYGVVTPSDLEGAAGRWPDPLIPAVDPLYGEARNAFPVDVPAGENRVAWVDVLVPQDAPPGVYRGTVDVRADGFASRVPVQLTVLAFTLPSTATLKSAFGLTDGTCTGLGHGKGACDSDPALRARVRQLFVRTALDNRITLAHPQSTRITAGDQASVDEFRSYFLPFFQGTAETRLPGARLTTLQVNRHTDRNIAGWRAEVELQGLGDRAFVWSCDEPHFFPDYFDPAGNWAACRGRLEADHASWPAAPKLVTAHVQSSDRHHSTHLFDIMVLAVELLHGPERTQWYSGDQRPLYDRFLADGARPKELWLYSACGSHGCTRNDDEYTRGWAGGYQIDGPASQTRAMPWLAFSYRMSGTLYYDTVEQLARAWDDQYRYTGNGEGTFFYPGTPGRIGGTHPIPIESMRMKFLRDGYEDYEYLRFLSDHGRAADAERIARALFPAPFQTTRTDAEIQAARRELASLVAAMTGGPLP